MIVKRFGNENDREGAFHCVSLEYVSHMCKSAQKWLIPIVDSIPVEYTLIPLSLHHNRFHIPNSPIG